MTGEIGQPGEWRSRRFRQYSGYKDSGSECLGEVPKHWDVAPVYARYEVALGKMLDAKRLTGEWPGRYLRNVDVQWDAVSTEDLPSMDFPPAERERYVLHPGDLLVCEGGEVGRTAVWSGELDECFYQKAIHRLRPRSSAEVPRFFFFLMYALAKLGVFIAGGNPNTIDHLTAIQLRHLRVPFPPAPEQALIATFLDRETARIDALVEKKHHLIELLQEKRVALVTRAVTRGLDPDVPMKDSGVEWLTETPVHWEVKRLGRTVTGCRNGVWGEEADGQHDTICVRVADFDRTQFRVRLDAPTLRSLDRNVLRSNQIAQDDLLLEKSGGGDKQPVGAVVLYEHDRPAVCSNFVARMPVADDHHPRYLAYLHSALYEARVNTRSIKQSTGIQNLDSASYLREVVGLPGFREQRAIASFLDRATTETDSLITRIRQAINHLNELRTGLISAAVTGKIDVREATPR